MFHNAHIFIIFLINLMIADTVSFLLIPAAWKNTYAPSFDIIPKRQIKLFYAPIASWRFTVKYTFHSIIKLFLN